MSKPRLDQGPDYERGFIDGMQHQMQSSVDKAVNRMAQPETPPECQTEAEKKAFAFGWFKAMEAQRLAQPEQEPVAVFDEKFGRPKMLANAPILTHGQKFYTTPPQRKWIGLDFDTIEECFPEGPSVFEDAYGDNHTSPRWLHAFARAIEAKLKEKNT